MDPSPYQHFCDETDHECINVCNFPPYVLQKGDYRPRPINSSSASTAWEIYTIKGVVITKKPRWLLKDELLYFECISPTTRSTFSTDEEAERTFYYFEFTYRWEPLREEHPQVQNRLEELRVMSQMS